MFERNFNDLEELITVACKASHTEQNTEAYTSITKICTKYFWGDITQVEFNEQIEAIRKTNN